jgi:hypothetical protein
MPLGPQQDVRCCAVSPDGRWVATGSHGSTDSVGAKVWEAATGRLVKALPVPRFCSVAFSPDGRWLLTTGGGCRLWEVGSWNEWWKVGGATACFSPDGRLLAVEDTPGALRLVRPQDRAELTRLEAPEQTRLGPRGFTPDGTRLITVGVETEALHIWDLRAVREQLAKLGLDWDAPAYSDDDPAGPSAPPLPPLQVDLSPLAWETGRRQDLEERGGPPSQKLLGPVEDRRAMPSGPPSPAPTTERFGLLGRGQTVALKGTTSAARPELAGLVLRDQLIDFEIRNAAGDLIYKGKLEDRVVKSPVNGTISFELFVIRDTQQDLPGAIASVTRGNFADFRTDVVEFAVDGLGRIGPKGANRSSDGENITFDFEKDPVHSGNVSRHFFILTDATEYAPESGSTILRATDGSSVRLATSAPLAHALPSDVFAPSRPDGRPDRYVRSIAPRDIIGYECKSR